MWEEVILEVCLPAMTTLSGNLNSNLFPITDIQMYKQRKGHVKNTKFWSILLWSHDQSEQRIRVQTLKV